MRSADDRYPPHVRMAFLEHLGGRRPGGANDAEMFLAVTKAHKGTCFGYLGYPWEEFVTTNEEFDTWVAEMGIELPWRHGPTSHSFSGCIAERAAVLFKLRFM